jgi:hypothetical protein
METLLLSTAAPSASTNRIAMEEAIRRNHLKKVPRAELLPGGTLILAFGTRSNRETGGPDNLGSPLIAFFVLWDEWDSNRFYGKKIPPNHALSRVTVTRTLVRLGF